MRRGEDRGQVRRASVGAYPRTVPANPTPDPATRPLCATPSPSSTTAGPFCGFQSQANGCGVQDALERALGAIAGREVGVHAAGRTDAGVHATSQVVHADLPEDRPADRVGARRQRAPAGDGRGALGARRSTRRSTRASPPRRGTTPTRCSTGPSGPALLAGRAGWYHRPLDAEAMREAAGAPRRRARLLVLPRLRMPGEVPGEDAPPLRRDARRRTGARRLLGRRVPAPHGPQPRRRARRRRRGQAAAGLDGRAARGAGPQARRADLRAGRPLLRRRRLPGVVRTCRRRAAIRWWSRHERGRGGDPHARQDLRHHARRGRARRRERGRRRDRLRLLARHAARASRSSARAPSRRRCRRS